MTVSRLNETSGDKPSARFRAQGPSNESVEILVRKIRSALGSHFGADRRIIQVETTRVEDDKVYGFLKVRNEKTHENFLLDFQASRTLGGTLSSLEVDGKRIALRVSRG